MNVLVFGAGVIGCYLTHVLCEAGHDVTLDKDFTALLEHNGAPSMPVWNALKQQMPSWAVLHQTYDKAKKEPGK